MRAPRRRCAGTSGGPPSGIWEHRVPPDGREIRETFRPSLGTALATGCHWLHVVCPACQQLGETDLRKLDIHPNASIRRRDPRHVVPTMLAALPFARPLGAGKVVIRPA